MSDYKKLYKIFDKEVITITELRELTNNELVASVTNHDTNKWQYYRYDIKLTNGELYIVYVRKNIWEILNIFKNTDDKKISDLLEG